MADKADALDVSALRSELCVPPLAALLLNMALYTFSPHSFSFSLFSGFLLQLPLLLSALALLHSELTDRVEPCSQLIGYCGSISCPGGVAYPQAQTLLTLHALLLNLSLLYTVRRLSARRKRLKGGGEPCGQIMCPLLAAAGAAERAVPRSFVVDGAKRLSEGAMLLGGCWLLVTGLYPAIPEPVEFCDSASACTTQFVATWHQTALFIGSGLVFSSAITRCLLAYLCGARRDHCCGVEVPISLAFACLAGRSLAVYSEATNRNVSWLPRLKVCYLHDTESACGHPGWGPTPPEEWPCMWNPDVQLPNRPCTDPKCMEHVSDNIVAIAHEVHLTIFAMSMLAACLARTEHLEGLPYEGDDDDERLDHGNDATPLLQFDTRRIPSPPARPRPRIPARPCPGPSSTTSQAQAACTSMA